MVMMFAALIIHKNICDIKKEKCIIKLKKYIMRLLIRASLKKRKEKKKLNVVQ